METYSTHSLQRGHVCDSLVSAAAICNLVQSVRSAAMLPGWMLLFSLPSSRKFQAKVGEASWTSAADTFSLEENCAAKLILSQVVLAIRAQPGSNLRLTGLAGLDSYVLKPPHSTGMREHARASNNPRMTAGIGIPIEKQGSMRLGFCILHPECRPEAPIFKKQACPQRGHVGQNSIFRR